MLRWRLVKVYSVEMSDDLHRARKNIFGLASDKLISLKNLAFFSYATDQQDMEIAQEKENSEGQERASARETEQPLSFASSAAATSKRRVRTPEDLSQVKRFIYASLGIFFLVVGVIGIVVPLLPTTPFLLLTAYLFSISSTRLHTWLLAHKQFGPPIKDWEQNRVIRPKAKVLALSMLAVGIFVLWFKFGLTNLWATVPSTLCMLASGAFVATRNSRPKA